MRGIRSWIWVPLVAILFFALGEPQPAGAKDKWLPINPGDLALKDNPASPGSDAMILYRQETLNEAQHYGSEYYRIKIFTQKGADKWGNVEIPYLPDFQSIVQVRGRTIEPNGTIVDFDGKAYDKVVVKAGGVKIYEKSFSLPDVQPGCIIEYKYNEPSDPGRYLRQMEWDVQRSLFTREAKFTFVPLPVDETGEGYYGWRSLFLSNPERPKKRSNGSFVLTVHNVPALITEPYMIPKNMIRGRVEFYYSTHGNETAAKFWKQQGQQWDKSLESFIHKKKALEAVLATTVNSTDSPDVKLQKIYARVQQIRNLSFTPSMTPEEEKREKIVDNHNVQDVLKHGYGTWEDINDLFVGLARAAGFDATLVYVAPRDRTIFVPGYQDPSELQVNIVEVKAGSQDLYLDPSSPQYPFGLLPWYENAAAGVRVTKQGGETINVPPENSTDAQILRQMNVSLSADGALSGTLVVSFQGQEAAVWRSSDSNDDQTQRRKDLHGEINGWLPANAIYKITKLDNWNDNSKPLVVEGTLKIPALVNRLYGRLILPLSLYQSSLTNAFTSAQRVNDIYLDYPFQYEDDTVIQLPSGFQVESLPKVQDIPLGAIRYHITANAQAGTVHITRKLVVNGIEFPVKYYDAVRSVLGTVKAGDSDDMLLERTSAAQGN